MTQNENEFTQDQNDFIVVRMLSAFALIPIVGRNTETGAPLLANDTPLPDEYAMVFVNNQRPGTPYNHTVYGEVFLSPLFGVSDAEAEDMLTHEGEVDGDDSGETH